MVKYMSLKQNIRSKKGTYILEASLIIPPFIIVMALLISIVSMISASEKALFVMGEELKAADIKAAFIEDPITLPIIVERKVKSESPVVDSVHLSDYGYLHGEMGMEDLISIGMRLDYSGLNPLGKYSLLRIDQRVRSRAFTGLNRSGDSGEHALIGYERSEIVYVFPNRGERYHNKSCPFLNPACEKVFLTGDIKSKFKPCSNCHSGGAALGEVVFCFFTDGKVYHLGKCSAVDKYYVEMEKKDAESRGYTACASCGG